MRETSGTDGRRDRLREAAALGVFEEEDRLAAGDEDQIGVLEYGVDVVAAGAFEVESHDIQAAGGEHVHGDVDPGSGR